MKQSRFSREQVIGIRRQQESGVKTADGCREHNISQKTFYTWKSKFGGMNVSEAEHLKALKAEKAKLKRIVADQALDIGALKDVLSKCHTLAKIDFRRTPFASARLFARATCYVDHNTVALLG